MPPSQISASLKRQALHYRVPLFRRVQGRRVQRTAVELRRLIHAKPAYKKNICLRGASGQIMKLFSQHRLRRRGGVVITNPKEALAIALSIAGKRC